jgi:hypothetical protein
MLGSWGMTTGGTQTQQDDLGIAAQILLDEGATIAAALLLDVESLYYEWDFERATAVLEVPHWQVDRFTEEIREVIRAALNETMRGTEYWIVGVVVRRTLPEAEGWRGRVSEGLGFQGDTTNQARLHVVAAPLQQDGLIFRSAAELRTYQMLKRLQEEAPPEDGMMIVPNAAVRIRDHTWELDFVITYRRGSGVLDVDGPRHGQRWAADRSRDKTLEDAGIAYVDRIPAEATDDAAELEASVRRFLRRLSAT